MLKKRVYDRVDEIPSGMAHGGITPGCLVLEGGGWKGIYTLGVIDCMLQNGLNLSSVVGVSAGALSAYGYTAGQIGWGARIDLTHRHDRNYCGLGALVRDHGITGFSYLFHDLMRKYPVNQTRLMDPSRRMAVSATNMLTGEAEYFEKGSCDLQKAVQASATVPFISAPVMMGGVPYLDGGCAEKIPFGWYERSGEKKAVVVRTRELSFRRKPGVPGITRWMYRKYPKFVESFEKANEQFNYTADLLEKKAGEREIFLIAPSEPVTVKRFDGDLDKLAALYWLGHRDMENNLEALKRYLEV